MRNLLILLLLALFFAGCTTIQTINYPPASELFVTPGDDPGSESEHPYTPKGMMVVSSMEMGLPFIPLFGLIPLGNADPDFVFTHKALPEIQKMGGDALIDTKLMHSRGAPFVMRLLGWGWLIPKVTTISGTVVSR